MLTKSWSKNQCREGGKVILNFEDTLNGQEDNLYNFEEAKPEMASLKENSLDNILPVKAPCEDNYGPNLLQEEPQIDSFNEQTITGESKPHFNSQLLKGTAESEKHKDKNKSYYNLIISLPPPTLDVMTIFETMVEEHFSNIEKESESKRGRPRVYQNTDRESLKMQMQFLGKEYQMDLENNISDRTDAQDTTVMRKIREVPRILLAYICPRSYYKNKSVEKVLKAYIECFLDGYVKLFSVKKTSKMYLLFLEFIVIRFPAPRVTAILNNFKACNCITGLQCKKYLQMLKDFKKTSLTVHRKLFESNSVYKKIWKRFPIFIKAKVNPTTLTQLDTTFSKLLKVKNPK